MFTIKIVCLPAAAICFGQVDPSVIVALFDARQPGVMLEVAAVAVKNDD